MAIDPNIKQKAENIRLKKKGREVRESLAAGLEAMSEDVVENSGRQNYVEQQLQAVHDSTRGKDVISATEILASQVGADGTQYRNMKERLDAEQNKVNAQLAQKASINYVDAILMDIAKGGPDMGPQGPFMSLAALNAYDFPDGRGGTWLVFDSSFSDGAHSFMWDSTNSKWKDLGVYQATGIARNSIGTSELKRGIVDLMVQNLVDLTKISDNKILGSDGLLYDDLESIYFVTDYIPAFRNVPISSRTSLRICLYDETKKLVSTVNSRNTIVPTVNGWYRQLISKQDKGIAMVMYGQLNKKYISGDSPALNSDMLYNFPAKEKLDTIADKITLKRTVNLFDKNSDYNLDGYVFNGNTGEYQRDDDWGVSHIINVESITHISTNNNYRIMYKDADFNFVGTSPNGHGITVEVPPNAIWAQFQYYKPDDLDIMFVAGQGLPYEYIPYFDFYIDIDTENKTKSQWAGIEWTSFGDSSVSANNWQPGVANYLGLKHTNRGIGGQTVVANGSTAYVDADGKYLARPPEPQPEGSTEISSSYCETERVNTIPLTAELVTITVGINDFAQNTVLGAFEDIYLDIKTTYYGALALTIKKIRTRIPNARIVLITGNQITLNPNGSQNYYSYIKATHDVGSELSCPVIDVYKNSGINKQQMTKFSNDGVHTNILGGKQIENCVKEGLKKIYPM